jgi:protocatechuate 3,4-dioxygenase beta subunit
VTSSGITIAAGTATRLVLTTQPSSTAESGAVLDQQPVIQLVDASGNPSAQAGVPVTAAIATGGGTLGGTVTVSTNASGQATFTDLFISGSAGTRTLVFFSGGLSAATSGPIAVSAAPVSGSQSTVAAAPSSFTAGSGASTITVVAKDASGGRVSGAGVTLQVTGTGNTVSTPAPTDANGTTTATLQSTGAGTKTITATINGVAVTDAATVIVLPAAPSGTASTAVASPTSVAVDAPSTVTVTVLDQYGNPVPGATVTLAAAGADIVQPAGTTGADGVATGTVSSATAGTLTVTVTVNGSLQLTAQPTITVSAPPVSGPGSTVTANPTTISASDGSVTSTVTVTVLDGSGAAIPSATVTLSATGSGNAITPASATSDGSGEATFAFSSTVAESKTLSATANGTPIHETATVTVTSAAASAEQSTANVPKSGTRNKLTTFTVQLRDAFANRLRQSGGLVTAFVTGHNAGALVVILDNLNGTYKGTYLPTASGHGTDFINILLEGTPIGGSPYASNL